MAADDALARERSLLQAITQATDVMLVYLDRDFNFVWVNASYAATCKMAPEEMIGKNHFALYPHAENEAIFRRVRDTGEPVFYKDKPFEFPDQPERGVTYWDWSLVPVGGPTASDPVKGLVFSLRETTRFKRAEQALHQNEQRFRLLFQNMLDGFAFCRMLYDADGRPTDFVYLDVNDMFARLTGLHEVVGRPVSEVIPGVTRSNPELLEIYGRVASTGRPERFETWLEPLGLWLAVSVYSPQKGHFVAVFDDITSRKQAEQERERLLAEVRVVHRQAERDLEAMTRLQRVGQLFLHEDDPQSVLSEIVESAVAIAGADLGCLQVLDPASAALRLVAQRGFPLWCVESWRSEDVGVGVGGGGTAGPAAAMSAEGLGACRAALERGERVLFEDVEESPLFAGGAPALSLQRRLGVRAGQSTPLVSRSGKPLGTLSTFVRKPGRPDERVLRLLDLLARQTADILERAQSEQALRAANARLVEADDRKNEFLAVLSHELRNPLAPIRNSLYLLDRAAPGGEQARRAQAVIERQVAHMTRLVDDLLDVSRITRGKIRLQRERFDLTEVVRRAVDDHRAAFEHVELALSVPDRPVELDGDRTRVAQVIGNLLQNAAKFTPAGGAVNVSFEVKDGRAIVAVRDTGVGVPPEVMPRLFEPFTQADRTLDRSKGGLGLGLALVKSIVELHGGAVSVRSEGTGKGAEFTAWFPLPAGAAAGTCAEPGQALPGAPAEAAARRRVLVIEDNLDAADSLREVLEFQGHLVEVAHAGPEGIEKARAFRPEVVLCDIGLPGMDGYAVARALRAEPAASRAFLVALTGYAQPDDVGRAKAAGFDEHLAKPPSLERLEQMLAR